MKWIFTTANFVARERNFGGQHLLKEWKECQDATVRQFQGAGFEAKFEQLLYDIKQMGFDAIELWIGHLHPTIATTSMVNTVRKLLDKYEMEAAAYTSGFKEPGITREQAVHSFEIAKTLGVKTMAQMIHIENKAVIEPLCAEYGIQFGLENHPEKSPDEVRSKIEPFNGWIGSCIDTGWFATQGCDPVKAIRELKDVMVHVHVKDILSAGEHVTCTLGDGIVPVREILETLHEIDWKGPITIEHVPIDRDPTLEIIESLRRCKSIWSEVQK
jgi:L-ribulose-5-phosphate 3-epimerase